MLLLFIVTAEARSAKEVRSFSKRYVSLKPMNNSLQIVATS